MKRLSQDPDFELQIVASAMHLSPEYGLTYQAIEKEGFTIHEKVEMLLSSDTPVGIAKSLGLGVISFADVFARLKPDLVILLGDRFESLAAAQAAFIAAIPIAHIHGGEITEGAYDDAIRHSLSKMSHLHFVAAEHYQKRVVQMGEEPSRVHYVGAMALDSFANIPKVNQKTIEQILDIKCNRYTFAITYQPETLESVDMAKDFAVVLEALLAFEDCTYIFTKGNADKNCHILYEMMQAFSAQYPEKAKTFTCLGHEKYLQLLQNVDLVLGNSSSGIIEAPFFKVPTVNIGQRQAGRVRAKSVLDCAVDKDEIIKVVELALSDSFKKTLEGMTYPYGEGSPAEKIIAVLKEVDLKTLFKKHFYDLV
jgi:UDP-N-acetylglucosamine 2-epimerase (non-hydrolysing)/GDP/UDP-N,N'-diacetylbacillosamine 2-epimerase (hydrolysing)